jgi:hypothetical protein
LLHGAGALSVDHITNARPINSNSTVDGSGAALGSLTIGAGVTSLANTLNAGRAESILMASSALAPLGSAVAI